MGDFERGWNTAKRTFKYYIFVLVNQIIAIMTEILLRIPKHLTSSPVLGDNKEWVLGALALAGGVASSLFGANKAKKAARRAAAENTYRTNAEKAWYDKNYNTDYLDTKAGQNLIRRAKEVQDEYVRNADGAAAVGGGTAASVAMAKESANKAMGDTIANIAAQDTSASSMWRMLTFKTLSSCLGNVSKSSSRRHRQRAMRLKMRQMLCSISV